MRWCRQRQENHRTLLGQGGNNDIWEEGTFKRGLRSVMDRPEWWTKCGDVGEGKEHPTPEDCVGDDVPYRWTAEGGRRMKGSQLHVGGVGVDVLWNCSVENFVGKLKIKVRIRKAGWWNHWLKTEAGVCSLMMATRGTLSKGNNQRYYLVSRKEWFCRRREVRTQK